MSTLAGVGTLAGVAWGGLGSSPYARADKSSPSLSLSFGMVPDPNSYQALSSVNGGPASNYAAPQQGPFALKGDFFPMEALHADGTLQSGISNIGWGHITGWNNIVDPQSSEAWYSINGFIGPMPNSNMGFKLNARGVAFVNPVAAGLSAGQPAGELIITGGLVQVTPLGLYWQVASGGLWKLSAWAAGSSVLKCDVWVVLDKASPKLFI
jgi:hypothetical protein